MTQHRLLLIRHAKTEQASPDLTRRLTDRGRRDATALGAWLLANDGVPDLAVLSPAVRARETWTQAAIAIGQEVATTIDERIYASVASALAGVARATPEDVTTLAIVGHNPSIEDFTGLYGGSGHVPTGTVVVFSVHGTWRDGEFRYADLATCRG